jgi:DNA-binding NarL/FixJ family response regulator
MDCGPVLIVDNDAPSRQLIADVLTGGGYECREISSAEDALSAAREQEPAAVILDVALPGVTGYNVCQALREEFGELLPIVFISRSHTDPLNCVAGLLLGADDYIVDPFAAEELTARVRRAITRSAALRALHRPRRYDLTEREFEILSLLAQGLTQDAIASELVISPNTVGTHIQRILAKLGVHSRAEAVAHAYRAGLLDGAPARAQPAPLA